MGLLRGLCFTMLHVRGRAELYVSIQLSVVPSAFEIPMDVSPGINPLAMISNHQVCF